MSFTRQDKIDLARRLDAWGVDILEAGIPAMGRAERATLDALHAAGLNAEILVWNRLVDADLDLCLASGYPSLHLSVPVSDAMIKGKLGQTRDWVLNQVERVVGRAAGAGRKVSLGAEDASRAEPGFVEQVFQRAAASGAARVRYADTLGLMTPARVTQHIGALSKSLSIPIDFHGHNDFGMATANTVAAFEAGAPVLSCSLLGLGERAGNAALEEVVAVLGFLEDPAAVSPQRFRDLAELCRLAADRAGYSIPAHKPLVGQAVFSHQSGIHVDGLLKDPQTYEAWPPESFGGTRHIEVGKHSGTAALRFLAAQRGVSVDASQARDFLENLRDRMGEVAGIDPHAAFESLLIRGGRR